MFEAMRRQIGVNYDERFIAIPESAAMPRRFDRASAAPQPLEIEKDESTALTLSNIYERFLSDPTRRRSARTMLAHHTTRRVVEDVLGPSTPLTQISRDACRDLLEILRWLPVNVSKKFPRLTMRDASQLAMSDKRIKTINTTNLNAYMARLTTMLNWAVAEEYIVRNPARGLQLAATVHPQDRRRPFAQWQLDRIFNAQHFVSSDASGSSVTAGARFWVPLLALYSGARLNELCQLDVADIREVEGIACMVITVASATGSRDKSLKTKSSERIVPLHPMLLDLGIMAFVGRKRRDGATKLFDDLPPGARGFRSIAFSRWFSRFLVAEKASASRTCFHSFRHGFRDAARNAKVERDIGLRLGGWITGGSHSEAADAYGSGYHPRVLFQAISLIDFPDLDFTHLRRHGRCPDAEEIPREDHLCDARV